MVCKDNIIDSFSQKCNGRGTKSGTKLRYEIFFYRTSTVRFFRYGMKLRYDIFKLSELRYFFRTVPYFHPCL